MRDYLFNRSQPSTQGDTDAARIRRRARLATVIFAGVGAVGSLLLWPKSEPGGPQPTGAAVPLEEKRSPSTSTPDVERGSPQESVLEAQVVAQSDSSNRLAFAIERPRFPPSEAELQPLTVADEDALLALYRQSSMLDRSAVLRALGCVGTERTTRVFLDTLLNESSGASFTDNEEGILFLTVFTLGQLAQRDDHAYEFVSRMVTSKAWAEARNWQSPRVASEACEMLADFSIQAVGMSGRSEADALLQTLKVTVEDQRIGHSAGSLPQAAGYLYLIRRYGPAHLNLNLDEGVERRRLRAEWFSTPERQGWHDWMRSVHKSVSDDAGQNGSSGVESK